MSTYYLQPFIWAPTANHTLPSFYWNVYSNEQRIKYLCMLCDDLCNYQNSVQKSVNSLGDRQTELEQIFTKFKESGFNDYYREMLEKWLDENLPWLWRTFATQVFFGLTDDGYFCAYVPESWSDIQFDTGAVYGRSDYGRLILKFEPEPNAHGVIDNTYSNYTLNANQQTMQQLIADLESTTRRSDATYNAMFSNLDVEVNNGNF